MEDDHVDRLGVQAQQCVELTSTNRSIGLIVLITNARNKASGRRELNSTPLKPNAMHHKTRPETALLEQPSIKALLAAQICLSPAWWPLRGAQTRSHPELGR